MTMQQMIQARAQSGFGISIATGMALERLVDPVYHSEVIEKKPKISADTLIIDLSTLIRNIIEAMDTRAKKAIVLLDYNTVLQLIGTIVQEEVDSISEHISKVVLVKPPYSDYSEAALKPTDTMAYKIRAITKTLTEGITVAHRNVSGTTVMLTHNAITLEKHKPDLLLLSHTGDVFKHHRFNKLLKPNGKDMCLDIPLTKAWIYILGDTAGIVTLPIAQTFKKHLKQEALSKFRVTKRQLTMRYLKTTLKEYLKDKKVLGNLNINKL